MYSRAKPRGIAVLGEEIKSLCTHVKELTDTVNQLLSTNERFKSI